MTVRSPALLAALSFALAAYLVAGLIVAPALASVSSADLLGAALVVDLVVLVPLAVAVVVPAHGRRVGVSLVVAALGAATVWAMLPEDHPALVVLLPLAEVVGLGVLVGGAVRLARRTPDADPYDRLTEAATAAFGDRLVARALAYEAAVVRYALGPLPAPLAGGFPSRRSSGYGAVVAGVAVAGALELIGGHLLVRHLWGDGAALVHGLLSGYALLWLWGDWRALGTRVTTLDGDALHVRCGLRWSIDVPVAAIEAVYHVRRELPTDRPTAAAVPFGRPRFAIDLREPVVATGAYGLRRRVTRVAIGADDPERFLSEIARAMERA